MTDRDLPHGDTPPPAEEIPGDNAPDATPLPLPRVDPVGVLERPEGWISTGRVPRAVRFGALILLLLFVATVVVTGAVSLGEYCLTTDGGDVRALAR